MREVVITGLGLLTPAGRGLDTAWDTVIAGKATAAHDDTLSAAGVGVTLSCRVPAFDPDGELGRGAGRRMDRYTHLALIAAAEALENAGLDELPDPDRVAVVLGCGIGGAETWEQECARFLERGPGRVSPLFIPRMLANSAAGAISIRTGARGPNLTVNTACASGATAIQVARDLLRSGSADVAIAGGVEGGITPLSVAAFDQMGALSRNPDPTAASRPFDVERDGFVMGEGAGIVVLEREVDARARRARPVASVAGVGASADAHHATAPPEDGSGAALAMRRALADADVGADDVAHINAHGTSTPLNDAAEARAIRSVFGTATDHIAVSSTKGVTGHLLGAAGAVEAVLTALAIRDGLVPPTAGLRSLDPEVDLDIVVDTARERSVPIAVSNSFGFGGQNAVLVLTAA